MVAYHVFTDEELIDLINDGDHHALDFLIRKYKTLVEKKSFSYFLMGASRDDVIQEGMIGLYKAIRDYKDNKEASFYTFADLCVSRQIITAVKTATRQKHKPLNSYVSLNKPAYSDADDKNDLMTYMPSNHILNPEELVIGKESIHRIEDQLVDTLSDFEKEVLQLYIEGNDYIEVAGHLDRSTKSIDNALQRIKKKVRKIVLAKS